MYDPSNVVPPDIHDDEGGGGSAFGTRDCDSLLPDPGAVAASPFVVGGGGGGDGDGDGGGGYAGYHHRRQRRLSAVMRRCGYALAVLTFALLVVFIPTFAVVAVRDWNVGEDRAAFVSAGAFVLLTVPISVREIYLHMTHYVAPDVQKYVVRILWMVPLYSVQSWLSLRYHEFSLYIDTLRDLYEAFVIQSFLYYLVEILGGEDVLAQTLEGKEGINAANKDHGEHPPILRRCCGVTRWEMGTEFMLHCKHGVLQYVVIKTFATILAALLQVLGMYGEGTFDLTKGYVYIALITNFSQMWALYCLVKLFYATKEELTSPIDWKPVGKFLCVKGVVFFTWWQGLGIALLQNWGLIQDSGTWKADDRATGLQDYLVCFEMLFFAIAHGYTFTYKEYCLNDRRMDYEDDGCYGVDLSGGGGVGGSGGGPSSPEHDAGGGAYRAPIIRKLSAPMDFSNAFWSSTLPTETISDIRRLHGGAGSVAQQGVGISMACVKNAESI